MPLAVSESSVSDVEWNEETFETPSSYPSGQWQTPEDEEKLAQLTELRDAMVHHASEKAVDTVGERFTKALRSTIEGGDLRLDESEFCGGRSHSIF